MKEILKKYSLKQKNIAKTLLNAIIKMSEVFHISIEEIVLAFKKEDLSQEQTQLDGQVKFDYID